MKQTQKILIVAIVVMAITLAVGFLPIHGEEEIYDTVVRLHVIANSDSEEDQSLKMQVRDEILASINPVLENCNSREEAIAEIGRIRNEVIERAQNVILENGYDYSVDIEVCREKYPTRDYGSFIFPSGEYVSVKVKIGKAEGQNFWCVLFPPICMSAATASKEEAEEAFVAVGFTPEQYRIITETDRVNYKIKFKLLEFLESAFAKK